MAIFNGTTRTASDVMTRVKRTFGDEAGVQITNTDIFQWINDGQRDIIRDNKVLRKVASTNVVAGTYLYPLDDLPIMMIQSVRYNGIPLKYINFQEAEDRLAADDPQRTSSGTPEFWHNFGGDLSVYPTPDTSLTAGFRIYYLAIPTDITNIGDKLSVPDIYFNALVKYVLAQAHDLDEDYNAAGTKRNEFTDALMHLSEQDSYSNNDAYPVITVLPEDM